MTFSNLEEHAITDWKVTLVCAIGIDILLELESAQEQSTLRARPQTATGSEYADRQVAPRLYCDHQGVARSKRESPNKTVTSTQWLITNNQRPHIVIDVGVYKIEIASLLTFKGN